MEKKLNHGWQIVMLSHTGDMSEDEINAYTYKSNNHQWYSCDRFPMQVQDVLFEQNVIQTKGEDGDCTPYKWIAEHDWLYRIEFTSEDFLSSVLEFDGLDTIVAIYLNGEKIALHKDMFLPLNVDISKYIKKHNVLLLHFYSPYAYLEKTKLPDKWDGIILNRKTLRKAQHDFDSYLGAKPYSTPIGVFRSIYLHQYSYGKIEDCHITPSLLYDRTLGIIDISVTTKGIRTSDSIVEATVCDPYGNQIDKCVFHSDNNIRLKIENPELWYPVGYGKQPLYHISVRLLHNRETVDIQERNIGFREISMPTPFHFIINGLTVRLWGANFAPLYGFTHCWDSNRFKELMKICKMGHINVLRIWGEGIPYPDELFDYSDREGILLWYDFYGESKMHPDDNEFVRQCACEAAYWVKKLCHRPSILLWCGGNEMEMWAEVDHPGCSKIGEEIYKSAYKKVCGKYNPERYYHPNSPWGGDFANDPQEGDTHGYDHFSNYVPHIAYPVMYSENTRVAPPSYESMCRFMTSEEIWPKGFKPTLRHGQSEIVPSGWIYRSADLMTEKFGPIEEFYDAETPQELVYNIAAARALQLKRSIEKCRRGRPSTDRSGNIRSFGHMVWKLNDSWPQIYTAVVDYYMDLYIPYYAMRRAYSPILISFSVEDEITVWVVNDTPSKVNGKLVCSLYDQNEGTVVKQKVFHVEVPQCCSTCLGDLNSFGQFSRRYILIATLESEDNISVEATEYLAMERQLTFADPDIEMCQENNYLVLRSNNFAHCVELSGPTDKPDGGFRFEDNYFDLIPDRIKRIHIYNALSNKIITLKTHYGNKTNQLMWR